MVNSTRTAPRNAGFSRTIRVTTARTRTIRSRVAACCSPGSSGAALIAGGADFFLITVQSSYTPMLNAVKYRWRDRAPSAGEVLALDREYLRASKLDPYNACAVLVGRPVLIIQGGVDSAVPSHAGDLLWERLGRPERMVVPLTHELLFAKLPSEFSRIEQWMSDAAESWRESHAGAEKGVATPEWK